MSIVQDVYGTQTNGIPVAQIMASGDVRHEVLWVNRGTSEEGSLGFFSQNEANELAFEKNAEVPHAGGDLSFHRFYYVSMRTEGDKPTGMVEGASFINFYH